MGKFLFTHIFSLGDFSFMILISSKYNYILSSYLNDLSVIFAGLLLREL